MIARPYIVADFRCFDHLRLYTMNYDDHGKVNIFRNIRFFTTVDLNLLIQLAPIKRSNYAHVTADYLDFRIATVFVVQNNFSTVIHSVCLSRSVGPYQSWCIDCVFFDHVDPRRVRKFRFACAADINNREVGLSRQHEYNYCVRRIGRQRRKNALKCSMYSLVVYNIILTRPRRRLHRAYILHYYFVLYDRIYYYCFFFFQLVSDDFRGRPPTIWWRKNR